MENQEKIEAWQRLSSKRVDALTEVLRKIGNLGNIHNYPYTKAEANALFGRIRHLVDLTEAKFTGKDE